MCYSVYISTDSREDLSVRNSELVRFDKISAHTLESCTTLLSFPHRWYVGSKSGCSCGFRHLMASDLGFSEPVEWFFEEPQHLAATQELYSTLASLVSSGHAVDLLDVWSGAKPDDIAAIDVSLDKIPAAAFRMFENYKFNVK